MFCSKCGRAVRDEQGFCPGCGQQVGRSPQSQSAGVSEQQHFDHVMARLSFFWYLFAAQTAGLGLAGLIMGLIGAAGQTRPFEPWPHPPVWNWTMASGVVWMQVASRVILSVLAGWGLRTRTDWSRPMVIVAGAAAITQFPIGLILGAYTIAVLTGKRHAALYAHHA